MNAMKRSTQERRMTMRTLELDTTEHKFDSVEYNVNVGKKYHSRAVLRKDYEKRGDGILWLLASGVCLKAVYSEKELLNFSSLALGRKKELVELLEKLPTARKVKNV